MSDLRNRLILESGLSRWDVERIIASAPRRYKSYEIPKRSGGMREIAQPARELKVLQRILIGELLDRLPVHDCAMAYREGRSIKNNAFAHAGHTPILKMDFVEFFPSIRSEDWIEYCRANNILSDDECLMTAQLLFRKAPKEYVMRLSIGAPSSPIVSNILMFEFDRLVSAEADRRKIAYTRYADDLTFSGQRAGILKDMIQVVEHASRQIARPKIRVNEKKTTLVTPKYRRAVTGLVLTNEGKLSLGRERKRIISAKVHHALLRRLTESELQALCGYLAFAKAVEPEFLGRLREKYGSNIIREIQRTVVKDRRSSSEVETD